MPDGFSVPAITKGELVEEVWAEVARHQAGATRNALQASPAAAAPIALPMIPAALSLPELLALDDAAFVDAAYHTLLRRPADPAGVQLLTGQLAAGASKVILLGRLRRSAEGRTAGQRLPGLGRRFVVHRAYRVPGLGNGLKLGGAVLRRLGLARVLGGRTALPPVSLAQMQAYVAAHAAAADTRREALERRLGEQQMALDLAARRLTLMQAALDAAERKAAEATRAFTRQLDPHGRRLATLEDTLAGPMSQQLAETQLAAERMADRLRAVTAELDRSMQAQLQPIAAAASRAEQAAAGQEARLAAVIATLRSEPAMGRLAAALDAEQAPDHGLDALYVAFEDEFRGSRDAIKERQRFYLPILAEAQAGTSERAVVDVGCGRGEFLELLHEQGLAARGVDTNVAMAELCGGFGLDVVADDAVSYLTRQDAGSLGAVTGFHVVEHLPFRTMVRLFDAALRALAPGGLMIFETPNPANLTVGSHTFHMDPTHLKPLPGQMMVMVARARGFEPAFVVELHPVAQKFGGSDPVLGAELDVLFHGPRDYALVARKP